MSDPSLKTPAVRKYLNAAAASCISFVQNRKEIFLLSLVWGGMILLVNPVGEFPLTDDWMYSHSVMTLLTERRFELFDFQAMTAVGHILWGALFSKIFGFSMTSLRLSVLFLGLIGIWSTHRLLRSIGTNAFLSFWGALTLATTPLYFGVANSFMTDVPFYALSITSYVFFIRYLQHDKNSDLIAGILLAIIAVLTRQLALIIPISFSLAYLVHKGLGRRTLSRVGIVFGITFGTFWIFDFLIKSTIGRPYLYDARLNAFAMVFNSFGTPLFTQFFLAFFWRASVNLVYLGFFLSPLLFLLLPAQWRRLSSWEKKVSAGITLGHVGYAVIFGLIANHRFIMPSGANFIYDFAFGPITIVGSEITTPAPRILWIGVTLLGMLGAGIILSNFLIPLLRFLREPRKPHALDNAWVWVLCASSCFFYFIPWGISGQFDRYNTFYMPFIMFLVLFNSGDVLQKQLRSALLFPAVLILLIGFFSVAGTHDYLGWNKVRWGVLRSLMQERGISPKEIDGGYEFNGWYTYYAYDNPIRVPFDESYRKSTHKSWWWVYDDKYMLSFMMINGYELLQAFPCNRWLPPYKAPPILLLRRIEKKGELPGTPDGSLSKQMNPDHV